ncbi:hypothetical protein [Dictyobacter kobayashii]|uniref:Asl1-like glycosyl hydrolase catalytic domain-containing protein n=1 Tax=Dictyobacter kobayashii TaxID=2014872 RepID=A0A402AF21_9CHLR|nr:hypothetical protein [Dictyobacter kobayashii]GCE17686.1 hypothetical protein KDK_14860 [Dictyobacter kobayashii]
MDRRKQSLLIFLSVAIILVLVLVGSQYTKQAGIQQSRVIVPSATNPPVAATYIPPTPPAHRPAYKPRALPGIQNWSGVSSFLFGANDASWAWSKQNMGNNSSVRATVRATGITIIRTPLTKADALQRVTAIEQAGAVCLGVLHPEDAIQVVHMLGNRCNLYEWQNEPDNGGPNVNDYTHSWNQTVPTLRLINTRAAFIGPAVSFANLEYIQSFLQQTKAAGNLPDAVSYHLYPCTDQSIATCPQHFGDYDIATQKVKTVVTQTLGHSLPLAVTEWNYSWKPGQTPRDNDFMRQFTTASLQSFVREGIAISNQFDLASDAGSGSLDMIDPMTGISYPQNKAFRDFVARYTPK